MAPDLIQTVPEQELDTSWGAEELVKFLLFFPEIWKDQTEPFYNLRKSRLRGQVVMEKNL